MLFFRCNECMSSHYCVTCAIIHVATCNEVDRQRKNQASRPFHFSCQRQQVTEEHWMHLCHTNESRSKRGGRRDHFFSCLIFSFSTEQTFGVTQCNLVYSLTWLVHLNLPDERLHVPVNETEKQSDDQRHGERERRRTRRTGKEKNMRSKEHLFSYASTQISRMKREKLVYLANWWSIYNHYQCCLFVCCMRVFSSHFVLLSLSIVII